MMYRENCEYHEKYIFMSASTACRSSQGLCTQLEVSVALFEMKKP